MKKRPSPSPYASPHSIKGDAPLSVKKQCVQYPHSTPSQYDASIQPPVAAISAIATATDAPQLSVKKQCVQYPHSTPSQYDASIQPPVAAISAIATATDTATTGAAMKKRPSPSSYASPHSIKGDAPQLSVKKQCVQHPHSTPSHYDAYIQSPTATQPHAAAISAIATATATATTGAARGASLHNVSSDWGDANECEEQQFDDYEEEAQSDDDNYDDNEHELPQQKQDEGDNSGDNSEEDNPEGSVVVNTTMSTKELKVA
jgi:hypothetical protein